MEKAKDIARGISGQLSLGFASSVAFHSSVFTLLHQFQSRYPEMELLTREENMASLMQDLRDGFLDAAFIRLPCESSKAFNLKIIASEKMQVALPAGHALSKPPTLSLVQLADEQLIMFPREVTPSLYELILSACLRAGLSLHRGHQFPQISSSLSMVAAGFGFAIVPESPCCINPPGVTFHPIDDAELNSDIVLAWQRLDRSPAVMHLVAMLKNPSG